MYRYISFCSIFISTFLINWFKYFVLLFSNRSLPFIIKNGRNQMYISRNYLCAGKVVPRFLFSSEHTYFALKRLTHWGQLTHICIGNLTIICLDNGWSPNRHQAIVLTNAGILSIAPSGTNFNEILIKIQAFSFKQWTWKCRVRNGVYLVSHHARQYTIFAKVSVARSDLVEKMGARPANVNDVNPKLFALWGLSKLCVSLRYIKNVTEMRDDYTICAIVR